MGVRIEAYAVDLPRLDAFLNTSLADLLLQYQRDGIDEATTLMFSIGGTPDTFRVVPGGGIRAWIGEMPDRTDETLTEDRIRSIEGLRRSAREHISHDNIYQAYWLLEGFSNCRGIDFVKRLTGDHRRWWIGCVLQSAQNLLDGDEYKELDRLFRKILRGYNCGFNKGTDPGFVADGLPFVPDNDPDMQFGRWSESECPIAMSLLSKIMKSSPVFKRPPEAPNFEMDDTEWHEWAQRSVLSFLQMRDLDYRVCNMLSFIG